MNKFSVNLTAGTGYTGPYISKFSTGFDQLEFFIDADIQGECTFAVVYSACGDAGMAVEGGGNVTTAKDAQTDRHIVTWTPGYEITCDSGIVVYQVVAYTYADDGSICSVWYSPQGRIVVGNSIDTTDYETAQIGASPSIVVQLMENINKIKNNNTELGRKYELLQTVFDKMNQDNSENGQKITELEQTDALHAQQLESLQSQTDVQQTHINAVEQHSANTAKTAENLVQRADLSDENYRQAEARIQGAEDGIAKVNDQMSRHINNGDVHTTAEQNARQAYMSDMYTANGLLNISTDDVDATKQLLADVAQIASDLRVAFMTGVHNTAPESYNKLKLLDSYNHCDYVLCDGTYACGGKSLDIADALDIAKYTGDRVCHMRGDADLQADVWSRIFAGDKTSYYYLDNEQSKIRLVVLDTCSMDTPQLEWFVNTALDAPADFGVIIFSHHNLAKYIHTESGQSLFAHILQGATKCGSVFANGNYYGPNGGTVYIDNVSKNFVSQTEIVAAVHGGDGVDSGDKSLADCFYNIGVADDEADPAVRFNVKNHEINMRNNITQKSDLTSVVRASTQDVTVDGVDCVKFVPLVSGAETYIIADNYIDTAFDGYIITQIDMKADVVNPASSIFFIATNQSMRISHFMKVRDIVASADEDGWVRITVVTCRKSNDINYGKSNTYINGISFDGWLEDNLGTSMSNGMPRSEIRVLLSSATTSDAVYYRRIAVYTSELEPSQEVISNGISDSFISLNNKFYNADYEDELAKTPNLYDNCYDVFCIDREGRSIVSKRFGFGTSRRFAWHMPQIEFE